MGRYEEVEVRDRERVAGLVGRRVEAAIAGEEGEGAAKLVATLEEVRDDGVVLSEVSELGPGPILFCPWGSLRLVRGWRPWFEPPDGEPEPGEPTPGSEFYDIYESRQPPAAETAPEPRADERREASARTLERAVPVAQRRTVGGITVAIASLELYGEGLGMLRWQVSFEEDPYRGAGDVGIPEPRFEIRDGSGRALPWTPRGAGGHDGQADGEAEVRELPEAGEVEVVVARLVADAYEDGWYQGDGPSFEGPWAFRFAI